LNRDNFWQNVARGGPDECWLWTRALLQSGHGHAKYEGRHRTAHAIAWELANEASVLPGICVCHKCDNPPCCNPAHLFLGTKGDNSRDRHAKGRTLKGEGHPGAKLQEWQIPYIRTMAAKGIGATAIARAYGVTRRTIELIVSGENWAHVEVCCE